MKERYSKPWAHKRESGAPKRSHLRALGVDTIKKNARNEKRANAVVMGEYAQRARSLRINHHSAGVNADQVLQFEWLKSLFPIWTQNGGPVPVGAIFALADRKQNPRALVLKKLYQGPHRLQKEKTFNHVKLYAKESETMFMFWTDDEYLFISEHSRDGGSQVVRKSIIYSSRASAMHDFNNGKVWWEQWVEVPSSPS